MKTLTLFLTTMLLIILASCGPGLSDSDYAYMELNAKAAKVLEKKYHLECVGSGAGGDPATIERISLTFYARGEVNINQARNLLITVVKEYIEIINTNKKFRPFMKNYPFTPENIDLVIFFTKKDGRDSYHPNIEVASSTRGNVDLKTYEEGKNGPKEWTEESYEEALEKVQQEDNAKSQTEQTDVL